MVKSNRIAAVVVWYKPEFSFVENISTYADLVDHTYIVDNSPEDHSGLLPPDYRTISYVWLGGNRGIAHALNWGCQLASKEGYGVVLTMDQDSWFEGFSIQSHIEESLAKFSADDIAVIGVSYKEFNSFDREGIEEVESVITSGNLLTLKAWSDVGGFDEKLFIDQVDHDFCYRLRRKGYRIFRNDSIQMNHLIGEPLKRKIFGRVITSTNHGWVRRYYQMRNALYLREKYPEYVKPLPLFIRDVRDHFLGILLLEKEVLRKYYAMIYGVIDFYKGRFGPWEQARRVKENGC